MRGVADCHAPLLFTGVFGSGDAIGGPFLGSPGRERCFGQSVATESLHGVERCSRHLWVPRRFEKADPSATLRDDNRIFGCFCVWLGYIWLEHGSAAAILVLSGTLAADAHQGACVGWARATEQASQTNLQTGARDCKRKRGSIVADGFCKATQALQRVLCPLRSSILATLTLQRPGDFGSPRLVTGT